MRFILSTLALLALAGCGEGFFGQPDMTSPCVGLDDSPCGPKRPVNNVVSLDGTGERVVA